METPQSSALVIGAANLDIKGHTCSYHVAKTSNPGMVRTKFNLRLRLDSFKCSALPATLNRGRTTARPQFNQ